MLLTHTHIFPITKTVYKLLTWRNPQETKVFFSILGSWTPQTSAAARPGAAHRAGLVGCRGGSPRAPVDDRCPWPARSSNVAGILPKIRKRFFFYPEKSWLLMIHWFFFGGNAFEQIWVCQKINNNDNNEWYVYFYEHQRTSVWVCLNIGCPLV